MAHRFRLPLIAGYLMAGVIIGPFTPGYVADQELANELSRDRGDPADVRGRAAFLAEGSDGGQGGGDSGALGQIAVATLAGLGLSLAFAGWGLGAG